MAIVLLVILNIIAIAVTAKVASGKNIIVGALIGLGFELLRILIVLIAMGIVGSPESPSALMVFLINFRIYNIPLLIGVGFFVAQASAQQSPNTNTAQANAEAQPESQATIPSTLEAKQERIAAGLCPKCGGQVASTDSNCPSCRINLVFAREHIDQL